MVVEYSDIGDKKGKSRVDRQKVEEMLMKAKVSLHDGKRVDSNEGVKFVLPIHLIIKETGLKLIVNDIVKNKGIDLPILRIAADISFL